MTGERHIKAGRDPRGHGTAMAGIIAADPQLKGGMRGYVPHARLSDYRAVPAIGPASGFDLAMAVTQAVEDGAEIICLALTMPGHERQPIELREALGFAGERGVLCCVPAGNQGSQLGWPAAFGFDHCLVAGAFGRYDMTPPETTHARAMQEYPQARGCFLAAFSNIGRKSGRGVDLLAPGVACLTTVPGGYGGVSGTSYATAHVAGMAAALLERFPDDRYGDPSRRAHMISRRLKSIADPFQWGRECEGAGQAIVR